MTLIDGRIPASLDTDGMTPDEKRRHEQLRAHRALMLLMERVPLQLPFTNWTIADYPTHIAAMYSKSRKGAPEARSAMRRLVKALGDGWELAVKIHDASNEKITVVGEIEGVRCELWVLVDRCTCDCHSAVTE